MMAKEPHYEEDWVHETFKVKTSKTTSMNIDKVIERIRDSHEDSIAVYTRGSCIRFCLVLIAIFPKGEILYDSNHAIFELNRKCYDINGRAKKGKHVNIMTLGPSRLFDLFKLEYET